MSIKRLIPTMGNHLSAFLWEAVTLPAWNARYPVFPAVVQQAVEREAIKAAIQLVLDSEDKPQAEGEKRIGKGSVLKELQQMLAACPYYAEPEDGVMSLAEFERRQDHDNEGDENAWEGAVAPGMRARKAKD